MARHGGNRSNGEPTKLRFRTEAEDSSAEIKLKIEINTRERQAFGSSAGNPLRR